MTLALLLLSCGNDPEDSTELRSPFRKVTLDADPGEPIGLAVLADGRVLHTTRRGEIWLHDPAGAKSLAASLVTYDHDEEGLQGIALDPAFAENGWVYVYYSPPLDTAVDDASTPSVDEGAAPLSGAPADFAPFAGVMHLSRFVFDGAALDLSSEQVILEVPVDRGVCCHVGGQIDFDGDGNLYLSTGDDTNPFLSDGFAPIDERAESHPALDAQRSSSNTNDLRGKLLRIRVAADGSYDVPEGNLFGPEMPQARPEIYAMGLRNPFRFSVNRATGDVYLADYAPDASAANPLRGPAGNGKWLRISAPGNYGWPYCVGALAYVDFDFATRQSGNPFDCGAPRNESPRNTGLVDLPPVVEPDIMYSYGPSSRFPELGSGGIGPMAGPAYTYDAESPSLVKWPEKHAGAPLFYEWTRDFASAIFLDASGAPERMERLSATLRLDNAIDMEFGPDGALYVLEYGDGYFTANPDAQLSRIEYVELPK